MAATPRIIVVGGGLAGLTAVIKLCEAGGTVDLFSLVPVKRSHSVCAQGGINAVKTQGRGRLACKHLEETVYGGDFLANQPPVKEMCDAAPGIIDMLDRMGVPFNRTPEGLLDFRRFGGTLYHRTAFAGATTGQQLLYALDEQVRRYESEGKVTKYEGWEFLSPCSTQGAAAASARWTCGPWRCGPSRPTRSSSARAARAIFGKSTNSVINTGTAQPRSTSRAPATRTASSSRSTPPAIPGADKLRLMSESARGEGGRVWVPQATRTTSAPRKDIPESER